MRKWSIKYLIFSLILLFGIILGSDDTYAVVTDWCPSTSPACKQDTNYVNTAIECTYKLYRVVDKSNGTDKTYDDSKTTVTITRKLNFDGNNDYSVFYYSIGDYREGFDKSFTPKNYGTKGDDTKYYQNTFDCPQSIGYYGSLNDKTDIYYSTSKSGSETWIENAGSLFKSSKVSIYKLANRNLSNDSGKITTMDECEFVTKGDGVSEQLVVFSAFQNDNIRLQFSLGSSVTNTWHKVTRIIGVEDSSTIYNNLTSGVCTDLQYAYFKSPSLTEGAAVLFSSKDNLKETEDGKKYLYLIGKYDQNDFTLFQNKDLSDKKENDIADANETLTESLKNVEKKCGSLKNEEMNKTDECNEALSKLNAASSELNRACTSDNVKLVSNEYKDICTNSKEKVDKLVKEGLDFSVEIVIDCNTLGALREKLQTYFTIIKILVPVLIIGLGIIDFIKATASSEDDALKKAGNKFVKRLLIGVVIILLPYIVDIILQLVESKYPSSTCDIK